jgi:hypothetical protein
VSTRGCEVAAGQGLEWLGAHDGPAPGVPRVVLPSFVARCADGPLHLSVVVVVIPVRGPSSRIGVVVG